MKFIDYFFYMFYRILFHTFKRSEDNAKWSSILYLGLYSTFFLYTSIHLYLYLSIDLVSRAWSFPPILILCILFWGLYSLRYYVLRKSIIMELEREYNIFSRRKQRAVKCMFGFTVVLIPALIILSNYITKHDLI